MNIGEFKERITLCKYQIIEKADGDFFEKWEDLITVWAKLVPVKTTKEIPPHEGWDQKVPAKPLARYLVMMRYNYPHFQRIRWQNKWFSLLTPVYSNKNCVEFLMRERMQA